MLNRDDNRLLTDIEGDAPMGRLFRSHWLPACLSEDLAEPDGAPVRVEILGERLVAFRGTDGRVGILDELCPHRRASLMLARNEDCGLRCIYHGWKMGVNGIVSEMPSEPEGSRMIGRVRQPAYPVHESGGFIWVYLGDPASMPDFVPPPWGRSRSIAIAKMRQHANWAQVVEGVLDSAHSSSLHSSNMRPGGTGEHQTGDYKVMSRPTSDAAPRIEVQLTDYGLRYAAIRKPSEHADEKDYVRITVFVAPYLSLTPPNANWAPGHMHVPIDNENTMVYVLAGSDHVELDQHAFRARAGALVGVDLDDDHRPIRSRANNYLQDRQLMKAGHYSGIKGVSMEDLAVVETMGSIVDRSKETLAASDIAIAEFRRLMLKAAREVEAGASALGLGSAIPRSDIRAFEGVVAKSTDWRSLALSPKEDALFRTAAE